MKKNERGYRALSIAQIPSQECSERFFCRAVNILARVSGLRRPCRRAWKTGGWCRRVRRMGILRTIRRIL